MGPYTHGITHNYNKIDCDHGTNNCIVNFLYAAGAHITEDLYKEYKDKMPQFIIEDQEHLPIATLLGLCKKKIRGYLLNTDGGNQSNLFIAVPQLPLPGRLKKFLLFNIDI